MTLAPKAARGAPYVSSALRMELDRGEARAAIAVLRAAPDAYSAAAPNIAAFLVRTRNHEWLAEPARSAVRVEAAQLLASIAGPSSAPDLESLTFDPCREVRDAAKAALARLGGR
jgi:hypothetical protein